MKKEKTTLFFIGVLILSFLFFGLFITWFGWLLGVPVSAWHLPLAIVLGVIFLRLVAGKNIQYAVLWSLIAFAGSIVVASLFFDYSFDGQVYHQAMSASLKEGWNPIYEHHNVAIPLPSDIHFINNHYLRGIETIESLFYATTGWLEAGKSVNILLIVASFSLCFYALQQKFTGQLTDRKIGLFTILLVGCPVVIAQSLTFYIDSSMYSLLLSMLAFIITIDKADNKWLNIIMLGMVITIAATIKLNTLFFTGVMVIVYLTWLAYRRQYDLFRRLFAVSAVAAMLGGFAFNYNPLVTNTIDHGHPLYPLMVSGSSQEKAWDIMTPQTPLNMRGNNRFSNVGISFFGRMQHSVKAVSWGMPTTFLTWVMTTDMRVGGFGQFFGLTLLLSFILYCSVKVQEVICRKAFGWLLIASVFALFVFAEGWWARYVPFFWWVPLVMMLYWELSVNKKRWQRWLAKFNYILISLNVLVALLSVSFLSLSYTKNSVKEFKRLSMLEQPIKVWMGSNVSIEDKLRLFGIQYTKSISDSDSTATFEWIMGKNMKFGAKRFMVCPGRND